MKNHLSKPVTLLDCTFRDGGYYNSWDFDPKIVSRYLQSIEMAGVDAIEIGFRFPPKKKFLGAFAYSTDHFLRKLALPKNCLVAVMVNAKDFLSYDGGPVVAVKDLFTNEADSPLNMVRIASHLDGLSEAQPIAEELKRLGYTLAVNLMQIASKTSDEIK